MTWGHPWDGGDSSRVQDHPRNVKQICATYQTYHACAAVLEDGTVVTWGHADYGGDSSTVQDQLTNAQQICGAGVGFLAILADGTVVTWGRRAMKISHKGFAAAAACLAFATWGGPNRGGDAHQLQNLLNGKQICATYHAVAVILEDGNVVTQGDPNCGGDSSRAQDCFRNVQKVYATESGFAAILADGTVVTWGSPECGGDSSTVQDQLSYI